MQSVLAGLPGGFELLILLGLLVGGVVAGVIVLIVVRASSKSGHASFDCGRCGKPTAPGARYCDGCGAPLR